MKKLLLNLLVLSGMVPALYGASLVWVPSSALWDTTSFNWSNTVTASSTTFVGGDSVRFDDEGLTQPLVRFVGTLTAGDVVVDSSGDYLFRTNTTSTEGISSLTSLTKRGTGKLTVEADNSFSGPVSIEDGTLQIGNASARGSLGTAPVTNNAILTFNRSGTLNFTNFITGSGKLAVAPTSTGTWSIRGTNTMASYPIEHSGAILLFSNAFSIGNPASVQVNVSSGNQRLQLAGGVDFPVSCPITFTVPAGDINTRAALMGIAGTNSFSGPIQISGGSYSDPNSRPNVSLYNNTAANLQITVNSSVSDVPGDPFQGNFYLRGNSAAGIGRMFGTINLSAAQLIKEEASTWTLYSSGNTATLTYIANGRLNLAAVDALPNAQLTINATLDLGGKDQHIGPLWSLGVVATGLITNSSTTSDALLSLSDGGVYYGTIKDNGTTKIGLTMLTSLTPHAQQLFGTCTYSGPTTLQPATAIALMSGGSIPNTTPIEMQNGSSIDVTSKSDLTFTLGLQQTLKVDGAANIAGNFLNKGTVELKANKTSGTVTNDSIVLASSYTSTFGGTLKINLSGESLVAGDNFKIFAATSYAGAFTNFIPATPGTGLAWDASTLTTDGILRVVATVASNPTNITFSVTDGNTLELSWPLDHLGWTLQTQTNANTTGLSTNWFDVPGSTLTNISVQPIDRARGNVFFRLRN